MLKEKLSKIFKDEGNNKKKIENLVFLLIILIITVVAINFIWKDESKSNTNNSSEASKKLASSKEEQITYDQDSLEVKLEKILSNMNGVGNVDVLITYNGTEELIPVYNQTDKKSTTNEVDSEGGTRIVEEVDSGKEVVYQNDKIITQKKISPKIEGAVIAATGANNSTIKTNIIQAVEAATGIATHKIQVFEKKN